MEILQNIWIALTSENEMLNSIIGIPFCFIEAYISMLLFTALFNINTNKKSTLLYVITFSVIGFVSRIIIPDPYNILFNLIFCFVLIKFLFKTSILKTLICEFLPTIIISGISFILLKIIISIFGPTFQQTVYTPIYRFFACIVEYLLMYFIYILIKKRKIIIYTLDNTSKKDKLILFLNFTFGIIAILLQSYINKYYSTNIFSSSIILISFSSLIIYFIISLYSLINVSKLSIAKQNLEEIRLMNKTLTILNDKIRAFRHDFNNIIQALGGYIGAKDIEGLEKYYSQLLKDCQEVNNLTGLNTDSINNPAIYSLIASKYYIATEQGIEFNIDIFMDLNSIDMKIYEFCRILGILLDNAIQATQECNKKVVNITIRKDNRNKRQLLIVENTYKDKDIDTEKIYEKGYSTKEGNTGLGLWEVRQILHKNTNLNLFTSKNDDYFKQQLEIYNS